MPGHDLPGEFYCDERIYRAEIENIWHRGWLFAGHSCEISTPGDHFTMNVDGESLIVMRSDGGEVQTFWNVCRHRGMELCDRTSGCVGRIVCPYHQWTYARDGSLISCKGMQEDLDKSRLGLISAYVRKTARLVFLSLAEQPPEFEKADEMLGTLGRPQGLARAKVAKMVDYEVAANWKIVWENNRECYHCNVNHPQYIKANFDHYNADDISARVQKKIDTAVTRSEKKWADAGLAVSHRQSGMTLFPDVDRNGWYSANRTPLVEGYGSLLPSRTGLFASGFSAGSNRRGTCPARFQHIKNTTSTNSSVGISVSLPTSNPVTDRGRKHGDREDA